jgi:hypothetical protein
MTVKVNGIKTIRTRRPFLQEGFQHRQKRATENTVFVSTRLANGQESLGFGMFTNIACPKGLDIEVHMPFTLISKAKIELSRNASEAGLV